MKRVISLEMSKFLKHEGIPEIVNYISTIVALKLLEPLINFFTFIFLAQ